MSAQLRIGYDRATKIGKLTLAGNTSLKQASEHRHEDFDRRSEPMSKALPRVTLPGGGD